MTITPHGPASRLVPPPTPGPPPGSGWETSSTLPSEEPRGPHRRAADDPLLSDLAVPDVLAKLAGPGKPAAPLDAETLTARLERLVHWGALLRSSHSVRASSITEYQRSRSRY
ncbi:DUF2397 family protein [Streptomyces anulatus]|uniref:DUF2397 family protein n=1 Tax=Streptomyces anulatus TaxID=1892 RepID=UPI003679F6BF